MKDHLAAQLRIHELRLHADPSRVVLRPFHLGWQSVSAPSDRARQLGRYGPGIGGQGGGIERAPVRLLLGECQLEFGCRRRGAHLHFDCYSGISGDMILGALVDVGVPFSDLVRGLKQLRLSGFTLQRRRVHRGAIHATKVDVVITSGLRKPLSLHRIHAILSASGIPDKIKQQSRSVFDRLAEAVPDYIGAARRDPDGSAIRLSQIVLELTERHEVTDLTNMRRTIAALQRVGCKVAIDDVGTGYAMRPLGGIDLHGLFPGSPSR